MPTLQGHAETGIRQHFADDAFKFDKVFFGQVLFLSSGAQQGCRNIY